MDVRVNQSLIIPAAELTWRFSRSSGPGGQHVNTTDTRAELLWDVHASAVLSQAQRERILSGTAAQFPVGVITVHSSRHRSQVRNRQEAGEKLAALIRGALAPAPQNRRATRPTRGSVRRHKESKKHRSQIKRLRRRPPMD